jgi:exodeoxyribonuclease-1
MRHAEMLRKTDLNQKISNAFTSQGQEFNNDVDFSLYGGFFSDDDKRKMDMIRKTPAGKLNTLPHIYQDKRLPELLFRYRARNYFDTLSAEERLEWQEFRQRRLNDPDMPMDLRRFAETLTQLEMSGELNAGQQSTIAQLKLYLEENKPG